MKHEWDKNIKTREWNDIDWNNASERLKFLQEQIVLATKVKDVRRIYLLQIKILYSFAARALAVRKVISNRGKRTAGVDNIIWKGSKNFWRAMDDLNNIVRNPKRYKALPLRRVWIPKNKNEKRPLGIPTMRDRSVQAIYNLALSPVIETISDVHSFGFREKRSTHDAILQLKHYLNIADYPEYILSADISKCFDKIDHKFLLNNTPMVHKHVLNQWLKAGVIDGSRNLSTLSGTPQGGIISPTLCNVTLNGIEKLIGNFIRKEKSVLKKKPQVQVFRYADDIIITGNSAELLAKCQDRLREFLLIRGLKLNETKTKILSIYEGFDFLGFNFCRRNSIGKYFRKSLLCVTPSKKGIDRIKTKIRESFKTDSIKTLLSSLNPIIRGWGEHKRISIGSKPIFHDLDYWIDQRMRWWVKKKRGDNNLILKYRFKKNGYIHWGYKNQKLARFSKIFILNSFIMPLLRLNMNPFIRSHETYYLTRAAWKALSAFRTMIYNEHKHKCDECGQSLYNGEDIELHHIVGVRYGGKYTRENIQPLHKLCHQKITAKNKDW
jgi:RNA-directed DNA polymerase